MFRKMSEEELDIVLDLVRFFLITVCEVEIKPKECTAEEYKLAKDGEYPTHNHQLGRFPNLNTRASS